jgi:hypothetical protein
MHESGYREQNLGTSGTKPSGHQEHSFGTSGTTVFRITLIYNDDQTFKQPLTSLTRSFLTSLTANPFPITRTPKDKTWKLKPIEGSRFPRKRRLFLDHLMKLGGG